jgi:hypothetical protein
MSGLTDARQALAALLEADGLRVYRDPSEQYATPCIRLHPAQPWIAASGLANGARTQRYELWAVAGRGDSGAGFLEVEDLVSKVTAALEDAHSWGGITWDRPGPVDMGGSRYVGCRGLIETILPV